MDNQDIHKGTGSLLPEGFINEMGRSKTRKTEELSVQNRKTQNCHKPEIKSILEKSDTEPNLVIRDWNVNLNV